MLVSNKRHETLTMRIKSKNGVGGRVCAEGQAEVAHSTGAENQVLSSLTATAGRMGYGYSGFVGNTDFSLTLKSKSQL